MQRENIDIILCKAVFDWKTAYAPQTPYMNGTTVYCLDGRNGSQGVSITIPSGVRDYFLEKIVREYDRKDKENGGGIEKWLEKIDRMMRDVRGIRGWLQECRIGVEKECGGYHFREGKRVIGRTGGRVDSRFFMELGGRKWLPMLGEGEGSRARWLGGGLVGKEWTDIEIGVWINYEKEKKRWNEVRERGGMWLDNLKIEIRVGAEKEREDEGEKGDVCLGVFNLLNVDAKGKKFFMRRPLWERMGSPIEVGWDFIDYRGTISKKFLIDDNGPLPGFTSRHSFKRVFS